MLNCSDMQQTANDILEVKRLSSLNLVGPDHGVLPILSGNQFRKSIRKWLSPSDPSTNHNIACGTHQKKTATWFFEGSIFQEWKSTGSLLWIHGKRLSRLRVLKLTPPDNLYCSWLGQKRYLVCRFFCWPLSKVTDVFCQFHGDSRP